MKKNNTIVRLKKVLLNDKVSMPNGLIELIKKDVTMLLQSYFELDESQLNIDITANPEGIYNIAINSKADRIKPPKFIRNT